MPPIRALCLWLLAALVGCNHVQPAVRCPATVEYTVLGDNGGVRIFLTAEGAARVDLIPAQEDNAAYTVLLPTSAQEVERLAVVIEALIDSARGGPRLYHRAMREERASIRCRRAGREHSIEVGPNEQRRNHVWEGVVKEIETVSLLDLAKAVASHEKAERHAERHDMDKAVQEYEAGVTSFLRWGGARCWRYAPGMIWEPEISMVFEYPEATDKDEGWVVRGLPEDVMALPGISAEWAVKLLRYAWCKFTEDEVVLSRSGTTVTVSFVRFVPKGPNVRWKWGLPIATISPGAREALLNAPGAKRE